MSSDAPVYAAFGLMVLVCVWWLSIAQWGYEESRRYERLIERLSDAEELAPAPAGASAVEAHPAEAPASGADAHPRGLRAAGAAPAAEAPGFESHPQVKIMFGILGATVVCAVVFAGASWQRSRG